MFPDNVVVPYTFNDEIHVKLLFNLVVPLIFTFPELNIELYDTVFYILINL